MSAVLKEDPRSIAELIADQKSAYSLQQRFYTDPDIYELELERIIYRNWIFAGHESQLPAPGDFRVLNVAGESAIIVRGKDGELKGFANVCRHRGSLVCLEEKTGVRLFASRRRDMWTSLPAPTTAGCMTSTASCSRHAICRKISIWRHIR
jgi:Rieske 2Fe-2S family protein